MTIKRITTFAERIKTVREEKGMSLKEFEKIVNTPAQTINRYELGQRIPKIDDANRIAELLNVDSSWLQGYDVPQERRMNAAEEKPKDWLAEVEAIFAQLSPDNRAKLLELAHLYLAAQSSNTENK